MELGAKPLACYVKVGRASGVATGQKKIRHANHSLQQPFAHSFLVFVNLGWTYEGNCFAFVANSCGHRSPILGFTGGITNGCKQSVRKRIDASGKMCDTFVSVRTPLSMSSSTRCGKECHHGVVGFRFFFPSSQARDSSKRAS